MITLLSTTWLSQLLLGSLIGVLLGSIYFTSLSYTVESLLKGKIVVAVVLQLSRFSAIAFGLLLIARWNVIALISATAGILVARHFILRQSKEVENV